MSGRIACFPPRLATFAMAATCAGWGIDNGSVYTIYGWGNAETKAFLRIWGASEVHSQLDGVVRDRTIYEKVAAHDQLRETRL